MDQKLERTNTTIYDKYRSELWKMILIKKIMKMFIMHKLLIAKTVWKEQNILEEDCHVLDGDEERMAIRSESK